MTNKAENKGLKEELFLAIAGDVDKMPALQKMNISLTYLAPRRAGFEMVVDPSYANAIGTAHGGLIASFVDTVMGHAGHALNLKLVTLEMNLNYFATVKVGERVTAEGKVIHAGRTTVVAEAKVYNSSNKLVAKSRGTYYPIGRYCDENEES